MIDHWSIRVHRLIVWVMMELILTLVLVRDDRTIEDISVSDCIPLKFFVYEPIPPIGIRALHVNIALTNRHISVKNSLSVDSHTHVEYPFIRNHVARSRMTP